MKKDKKGSNPGNKISRRDVIKNVSAVSLLAPFAYGILSGSFIKDTSILKRPNTTTRPKFFSLRLDLDNKILLRGPVIAKRGTTLKIGIIGVGNRSKALMEALGFMDPKRYKSLSKASKKSKSSKSRLETFLSQEMLNVEVVAICDVFDYHLDRAERIVTKGVQPNAELVNFKQVKRYLHYQDLLANKNIDAVVIATPDFHHAEMIIAAAKAGKHVYCEKAMTHTEEELYEVYDTVKNSNIVFQLGHQLSKSESYKRAREIINKKLIGDVNLVEVTTNRNTDSGAWIRHLDSKGNLKPGSLETINWDLWLGKAPKVPFSLDRFYGWAKWFDYDTGLAGQLFSHEMDGINQIMGFGIPKSVTSSGGLYVYNDGRDMPDTFQVVAEFPDRKFSVLYSATLNNSRSRGRVYMGTDGSMEVGGTLKVFADSNSSQYEDKIKKGLVDSSLQIYSFPKDKNNMEIDAVSGATEKYYADRGLMDTKIGGKSIDITYLHIKEWVDAIRDGGVTSCNIEKAFIDTVPVLMAHKSYVEKRRVEWDSINRRII